MFKLDKKGFTLVEILVVILIIGILFVAFLPKIDFAGDKARETGVKSDLRTFMLATEQLFREYAGLKADGLNAAGTKVAAIAANADEINKLLDASTQLSKTDGSTNGSISGDAIKTNVQDPWKKEYELQFIQATGTGRKIVIASNGKNQKDKTPDFLLLTTYKDGVIKSCTFGLNNNIGEVTGMANAGVIKDTDYANLNCK